MQSRWVRVVHLVDLVGVLDSGGRRGDDDDHVVVSSFMGEVGVCAISLVFISQAMYACAATHASGEWPFASHPTLVVEGGAWRT